MRISLDWDGTLTKNMDKWLEVYNKKNHTHKILSDMNRWCFYEDWGLSYKEFIGIMEQVWKQWQLLPPQEWDEGNILNRLKQKNQIDVVTGVEDEYLYAVRSWCFMHNIPHDNLYHETDKSKLNYDIFIDDNPELAQKLLGTKKIMFMPSRPWNMRFVASQNIVRVFSWADIENNINMLVNSRSKKI